MLATASGLAKLAPAAGYRIVRQGSPGLLAGTEPRRRRASRSRPPRRSRSPFRPSVRVQESQVRCRWQSFRHPQVSWRLGSAAVAGLPSFGWRRRPRASSCGVQGLESLAQARRARTWPGRLVRPGPRPGQGGKAGLQEGAQVQRGAPGVQQGVISSPPPRRPTRAASRSGHSAGP